MSIADKIFKIKELLDTKTITLEEYEQLKKEILSEVNSKGCVSGTTSVDEKPLSPQTSVAANSDEHNGTSQKKSKRTAGIIIVVIAAVVVLVPMGALIVNCSLAGNNSVQLSGTTWSYVYPPYREGSKINRELYPEGETQIISFYGDSSATNSGMGFGQLGGQFEWTLSSDRTEINMQLLTLRYTSSMTEEQYEVRYAEDDRNILWAYSSAELHLPNVHPTIWKLQ